MQSVVADDPDDAVQVKRIRQDLAEEADRFRAGDFDDPAMVHGDAMPGLAALRAGAAAIDAELVSLSDGARIVYVTNDPDLVVAPHLWAQAQMTDHGDHVDHVGANG